MTDEQTNPTDTPGEEDNTNPKNNDEPISEYDKALELVKRREEVTKVELEVIAEKKKLAANEMLSGTAGGHVEPKPKEEISNKDYAEKALSGELNDKKE
jgi:hypothetical protein